MSISWTLQPTPSGRTKVVLVGAITEDVDLTPLLEVAPLQGLVFDLQDVVQINSCGVREWIHFVRALSTASRPYAFRRCSPAIVRQLNMISNFAGTADVESVMLPYYCDNCSHEENRELALAAGPLPSIETETECPVCQGALTFDDLAETYLSFAEDPSWARQAG
jgi:hypothetical protein